MDDLISRAAAIDAIVFNSENRFAVDVLNDVPAVDAIPVEWLEAHRTEYFEDWGNEPVTIEHALIMWQKEQEAMA